MFVPPKRWQICFKRYSPQHHQEVSTEKFLEVEMEVILCKGCNRDRYINIAFGYSWHCHSLVTVPTQVIRSVRDRTKAA